jgi:hypothetical protein
LNGSISVDSGWTRTAIQRRVFAVAVMVVLTMSGSLTLAPAKVIAVDCVPIGHCYSTAYDNSATNYTGLQGYRYVLPLDNGGGWIFTPMWLQWVGTSKWAELGTAYGNHKQAHYGYLCNATLCDYVYWQDTNSGVTHQYTIARRASDHTKTDLKIDTNVVITVYSTYQTAPSIGTGLESYNTSITFPLNMTYSLKYKTGDGAFQNWAGQDASVVDNIMCGTWVNATSWMAGEHTTC